MPRRFQRPDIATDEGGLWAMMDREETRLRRSPFVLRDPGLRDYVQSIACRLAEDHCPDIRVYLVHTPLFNASMAPNGMMQLWTGLLLRMENEAQLAAVLGHEIGHYVERHMLERLRDARARSAFGQFLGLFGLAGAVGQLVLLASAFGYSRDQERAADRIGLELMRGAGYDPAEAAKVWGNLVAETKSRPEAEQERGTPMFATHPGAAERQEVLASQARAMLGGTNQREVWQEKTRVFRRDWLTEEVKRGQYEESITLFTRMIADLPHQPDVVTARGEAYRLRARAKDLDAAIADFQAAAAMGSEPAEAHRGLALIYRQRNQIAEARASFQRYVEAAPGAPDVPIIRSYLKELE